MKTILRFNILSVIILIFFVLLSSCRAKTDVIPQKTDDGCGERTVPPQSLKTDVAWIVMEWNCKPGGYGSGFLIDKENGAFYTNKHVVNEFDSYGKGSHKIYFNGKFYNAEIVKVPPLRDAAIIRITDEFDSSEFPEPAPIAKEKVKVGDVVIDEGFHVHPYLIVESKKGQGYDETIIPIWDKYYNLGTKNVDKRTEIVFERITGKVSKINDYADFGDRTTVGEARDLVNTYTIVKADKDHMLSFGGLSGSVVRNTKGEIVGIFTMGPPKEFEEGERMGDIQFLKRVYKTFGFTPIESVADLRQYIGKR